MKNFIEIRGAREHNLKNIDVSIEKNKLTVITGLSGSGKSSLAFDTIYAEGQRRFIDSLSTYARNFLSQMTKPDVDSINGLCPSIAIDQKTVGHSPRSTVGTVTEIYDYLRLLYAKAGVPTCPEHKIPVEGQPIEQIKLDVDRRFINKPIIIMAPVVRGKKGEFKKEIEQWIKSGYLSAKVDGDWVHLDGLPSLKKTYRHDIDIVIDKIVIKDNEESRIRSAQAISTAIALTDGLVTIEGKNDGERLNYSTKLACPVCSYAFDSLDPLLFSFNNPKGACESCLGLGTQDIDEYETAEYIPGVGVQHQKDWRLHGNNEDFEWKDVSRCNDCDGSGLKKSALNVFFQEQSIYDLAQISIKNLQSFFANLNPSGFRSEATALIIPEIQHRLDYLNKVGTGYLSLARRSKTLSGGEAQRIRLASQVGTPLVGVLYVLDEPSIGLHPRDHNNVLAVLRELKDRGNTVIVVEHDEDTIRSADNIIDIGPQAGRLGGELIYNGDYAGLVKSKGLTGSYLSGSIRIPQPTEIRPGNGNHLSIEGAQGNNLKGINCQIPLGTLTGVTGVSGSGKSTLIIDTLYKHLANHFLKRNFIVPQFSKINGIEHIDNLIQIDQKPIGRTPRSCPATYVGLFPLIRSLFTQLPESKIRGYDIGRFSFNVKGGRCENCSGAGLVKVSMQFLSDVYVKCDMCQGQRYNPETLLVKYKGKSISDILSLTVEDAYHFFENHQPIRRKLETLLQVGLGYITLGQNSTTLSGGEAQRIKLSRELSKKVRGHTLYILDEPTTGLHIHDVAKLIELLSELVNKGNTVIIVEHNLDVIKSCDYIIDLGPEGGFEGGQLVYEGDCKGFLDHPASLTADFLRRHIQT
jgi:excinuclease ABC subunit A